ncbi:MAG: hypothetical protein EU531_04265 [Promethearchaeota archaeon]|nr:MAG: hypothetical protein EU531_04265 [Candidatus Lokiarchaeota archaeon]
MSIEIDDAGTGDLVGDVFIGFLRKDTGKIIFRTLSIELFNKENWKNKMPYKRTVELVKSGLKELNFDKDKEKIYLCRGNIFDNVRDYFDEEGINYEPAIIEGRLQDAVEGKLVKHLRNDLGIRSRNLTKKSGAKRYFVLFNWVCRDFYKREKYVKSGFKRWNTVWRERAIEKYEKMNNSRKKIYKSWDRGP